MTIDLRLIAAIVVAVLLAGSSAVGGFFVGQWRSDSGHAAELQAVSSKLSAEKDANHQLQMSISEANKALAVAEAQTRAAEQLQAQATANAEAMASFSKSRLDKLASAVATATGCSDVLGKYWELKQ